jgi:glycyl-tRNA synthetase
MEKSGSYDELLSMTNLDDIKKFIIENQFIVPSYMHYNGLSGCQDYGMIGTLIKNKLINRWRSKFINNNIHEVETPTTTPYTVLKASGHADRFFDYMVTGDDGKVLRADHLVKDYMKTTGSKMENVDSWNKQQLEDFINEKKVIKSEKYVTVDEKNLMSRIDENYLRPELAQGIFVNFKQYEMFNGHKLPFGIAQTGKAYRREISPHAFTRLREFTLAEIEYFFDPENDKHDNFRRIEYMNVPLYTQELQESNSKEHNVYKIKDAVDAKIICNEIMGYFIGEIYAFAVDIGLDKNKIRFRQHMKNEMAHYSVECWDLECLIDDNWLECVGIAHRGHHDLTCHGIKMKSTKNFIIKHNVKVKKQMFYKNFGAEKSKIFISKAESFIKDDNIISGLLSGKFIVLDEDNKIDRSYFDIVLDEDNKIDRSYFDIEEEKIWEEFVPNVIEPSIGIDRIFYALMVHNMKYRMSSI